MSNQILKCQYVNFFCQFRYFSALSQPYLNLSFSSPKCCFVNKMHLTDTVSVNKMHLTDTVSVNKVKLTDRVSVNKVHLTDTVSVNEIYLIGNLSV